MRESDLVTLDLTPEELEEAIRDFQVKRATRVVPERVSRRGPMATVEPVVQDGGGGSVRIFWGFRTTITGRRTWRYGWRTEAEAEAAFRKFLSWWWWHEYDRPKLVRPIEFALPPARPTAHAVDPHPVKRHSPRRFDHLTETECPKCARPTVVLPGGASVWCSGYGWSGGCDWVPSINGHDVPDRVPWLQDQWGRQADDDWYRGGFAAALRGEPIASVEKWSRFKYQWRSWDEGYDDASTITGALADGPDAWDEWSAKRERATRDPISDKARAEEWIALRKKNPLRSPFAAVGLSGLAVELGKRRELELSNGPR